MSRPIFVTLQKDDAEKRVYEIEAAQYTGTATIIKETHNVEYKGEAPEYIINHWKGKKFLDNLILGPFENNKNPKEYAYA